MDRNEVFSAFARELADMIIERIDLQANKRLYGVVDAAIYLGCSEEQLDNYVKSGRLKKTMTDRKTRYDIRDLDRMVEVAKSMGRR